VNPIATSFAWPFRGEWRSRWLIGVLMVALLPIAFVPLLGYAVEATRSASADPTRGLPRWRFSVRLLAEGLWIAIALVLIAAPFALAWGPLATLIDQTHVWHARDAAVSQVYSGVAAAFVLALPWGLVMLLVVPHATVRFATSGRAIDLFDFPAAIRGVTRDFATWNLVAAAIVTAWAIGIACVGILCAGIVPGIFYAILVSAHASAALHPKVADPATR